MYDCVAQILKDKEKLSVLFQKLGLKPFKETEFLYLEEYITVMKPLAITLDVLQGENNVHYGYLLPSLVSLLNKYEKMKGQNKFKYGVKFYSKCASKALDLDLREHYS